MKQCLLKNGKFVFFVSLLGIFALLVIASFLVPKENLFAIKFQLRGLGYRVTYNQYDGRWLWQPTGVSVFSRDTRVNNSIFNDLEKMPHLYAIQFHADLRAVNFDFFSYLPKLTHLGFINCTLDISELEKLSKCNLTWLVIDGSDLRESSFLCQHSQNSLTLLTISSCSISDEHLRAIAKFSELRHLDLSENPDVTDVGLLTYLSTIPSLQSLNVNKTGVTENGIEQFRHIRPDVDVRWR